MSKKSQYITTNRSKHYLKCHLILVTKYRRNILVGQLNDDLKSIFSSIADKIRHPIILALYTILQRLVQFINCCTKANLWIMNKYRTTITNLNRRFAPTSSAILMLYIPLYRYNVYHLSKFSQMILSIKW